jgi:DNA topoisomerase I
MTAGAGLRFSNDQSDGITRRGTKRFHYSSGSGKVASADLERIRALAIPPAWTDVWICSDPRGHLQATGRDARGRKQSKYHPEYRKERDNLKFEHLAEFGSALPRLRRRIDGDLSGRLPSEARQTALVVQLLDRTAIRVGNEQYRRSNGSFGLSTLRDRHARVSGTAVVFTFPGKSGQHHRVELHDRRLARLVGQCQDLPGQVLFSYLDDDGCSRPITSEMVNDYIRCSTGSDFTAKTFRTWIGTTEAATALVATNGEPTKAGLLAGIDHAADVLGNTRTVCRGSYVHPAIQSLYLDGELHDRWMEGPDRSSTWMHASERRTLHVIKNARDGWR